MKNKLFGITIAIILLLSIISIGIAASSEKERSNGKDKDIERIDFIHYAKSNPAKGAKTPDCYKTFGKLSPLPANYVINPTNPQGLDPSFITSAISTSAETWDASTSKELFNNLYTIDYAENYGERDYKNVISFGDYGNSDVIAVTSIWLKRTGRIRQIVEFDILFNTDYTWGDARIDPTKMDLQNIAIHEIGHGLGLDDIYLSTCSAVTMFGYSWEGDIAKRDLETPDIAGLRSLYG